MSQLRDTALKTEGIGSQAKSSEGRRTSSGRLGAEIIIMLRIMIKTSIDCHFYTLSHLSPREVDTNISIILSEEMKSKKEKYIVQSCTL